MQGKFYKGIVIGSFITMHIYFNLILRTWVWIVNLIIKMKI
jgi:hypothetical protein